MEKRALVRKRTKISIVCSGLTAGSSVIQSEGIMLNCSSGGSCIEIYRHINRGSILIIKATGWVGAKASTDPFNDFRTISIAEVRWLKPADEENDFNYRIGLKYLPH